MTEQKKRGGERPSPHHGVGYGRPPVEHQFRKGEPSRNPHGRRGKLRRITSPDAPRDFLEGQVTVNVNGRPVAMTRDEALDHSLFQAALRGNVQATRRLDERRAERERRHQAARSSMADPTAAVSAEDEALIAEALHRRSRATAGADGEATADEGDAEGGFVENEPDESVKAAGGTEQPRRVGHV